MIDVGDDGDVSEIFDHGKVLAGKREGGGLYVFSGMHVGWASLGVSVLGTLRFAQPTPIRRMGKGRYAVPIKTPLDALRFAQHTQIRRMGKGRRPCPSIPAGLANINDLSAIPKKWLAAESACCWAVTIPKHYPQILWISLWIKSGKEAGTDKNA